MKFICLVIAILFSAAPVLAHESVLTGFAHEFEHGLGHLVIPVSLLVAFIAAPGGLMILKKRLSAIAGR